MNDFTEILFIAAKGFMIVMTLIHLFIMIFMWRQVINMHGQVKTPTGGLLIFLNLVQIVVVFITLLAVIFLLSSKLN